MLSGTVLFVFSLFITIQGRMNFVFNNCGSTDFFELKSRTVAPYPIPIGGKIVVTGEGVLYKWPQGGEYDLEVNVEAHWFFGWYSIPCSENVGSCTYDVCSRLGMYKARGCPQKCQDANIPCTCETLEPGTYRLNGTEFQLPKLKGAWSWLVTGDYKLTLKLKDHSTKNELACLHGEITLVDEDACSGFLCSIFG